MDAESKFSSHLTKLFLLLARATARAVADESRLLVVLQFSFFFLVRNVLFC